MKVSLTEHLDRSEDKRLLRGCIGDVHSWVWPDNEARPHVVYVKFPGAKWQLDGIDEAGVYPIFARTKKWFLDSGRKVPVLAVARTQLPLAPGYAMTAHSSQGKTLAAVLLDLNVDKKVDPTFGTVATTRVRSRDDVLILRPFPDWLFKRGTAEGPKLLLEKLRGDRIDWAVYRASRKPTAACEKCRELKMLDCFSHEQWELARANKTAVCMACKAGNPATKRRKLENKGRFECLSCITEKVEAAFPRAQLNQPGAETKRRCLPCLQAERLDMPCVRCTQTKPVKDFEPEIITLPLEGVICLACQEEVRQTKIRQWKGYFGCKGCSKIFPVAAGAGPVGKQQRHCLNCSSRDTRMVDQHTCRTKGCKRKWTEKQPKGQKRQRYCPDCRKANG